HGCQEPFERCQTLPNAFARSGWVRRWVYERALHSRPAVTVGERWVFLSRGRDVFTMLLAPLPPGHFPFEVGGARLVVGPLRHESLCSRPRRTPALVMCRVAIG